MRLLRLLFIHAQIILTGSVEPLMTQDFLNVDNGTSIENEVGSHRMAEDVRSKFLIKYYIGTVEKDLAKKVMQDEHYRFIPKEMVGDV